MSPRKPDETPLASPARESFAALVPKAPANEPSALEPAELVRRQVVRDRLAAMPALPEQWRELVSPPLLAAIARWGWQSAGGIALLGNTGAGKSLALIALARRLLVQSSTPESWVKARALLYVDAAKLAVAREQWGFGQGEAPLVERAIRASVLLLDEVGYIDRCTGVLEHVVDCRNKRGRPIIFASGLKPEELAERYGDATARKLLQGARTVSCFGRRR